MSSIVTDISVVFHDDGRSLSGMTPALKQPPKTSTCSSKWDLIIWTLDCMGFAAGTSTSAYLFQDKSTSRYRRD